MADIDVYKIEDEEVNEEEFVSYTLEKYNIYLENHVEEYFKDLKGLPLGLSTNNAWDYSIHMAHKMFQYWLYLVYKILHLNKVSIEMKELLIYKLNKDLLFYNTNYQHVLIFNPVIYNLEHNGGLMSPQAKLNYKGHYSILIRVTVLNILWYLQINGKYLFLHLYICCLIIQVFLIVIRNGHMQCITVLVFINLWLL